MGDPELHEDVRALAFLVGTWRGRGAGSYPTIEDFLYEEEIRIEHAGDAYLTHLQRSWSNEDGSAIHLERGFIRPGADGEVELTLAHPLGLTEIAHGTVEGTSLVFTTDTGGMGRTRTGMEVTGLIRRYAVSGDELTYEVDMATGRTPMTRHLAAILRRQP
ncbi:MAG: FABP family protein [Actinomycetota bacterium]